MCDSSSIEPAFSAQMQCRTCLLTIAANEGRDDFVDLLEPLTETLNDDAAAVATNLQCLNACTSLEIAPQHLRGLICRYICGNCRKELHASYQFISKALASDRLLNAQQDVHLVKIEIEEDTEQREDPVETTEEKSTRGATADVHPETEENLEDSLVFSVSYFEESSDHVESTEIELLSLEEDSQTTCSWKDVDDRGDTVTSAAEGDANEEEPSESDEEFAERILFQFECELCTDKYELPGELLDHYANDHDKAQLKFGCDQCDGRFVTRNALRMHKREIHLNCEYVDCAKCGRRVQKTFYKTHLKRHKTREKVSCELCPRLFANQSNLKKHMILHSDDRRRDIQCPDCHQKFFTVQRLQRHQVIHEEMEKRTIHACTLCEKTFLRQSSLRLHMQMHRGKTIDCEHCGKKFVRRKDLEIHVRFHTGNYPYECSKCNKKFAIKGHLRYHEQRHSGKRYKCHLCDKDFINRSGLKQHSYEHTRMPFVCEVCKRGFPTRFKIRRHVRTVHHELFETAGYSDALAELYIVRNPEEPTPLIEEKLDEVSNDENEEMNNALSTHLVEMLDEHTSDISKEALLL